MSKQPSYWSEAKKYLSKKDKVMKNLIKKYSDASLTSRKDVFFRCVKVSLASKLVLLQQIQSF